MASAKVNPISAVEPPEHNDITVSIIAEEFFRGPEELLEEATWVGWASAGVYELIVGIYLVA